MLYGRGAALLSDSGMRVRRESHPTWQPDLLSLDSSSSKYARTTLGVSDGQVRVEHAMVRSGGLRRVGGRDKRRSVTMLSTSERVLHGELHRGASFYHRYDLRWTPVIKIMIGSYQQIGLLVNSVPFLDFSDNESRNC